MSLENEMPSTPRATHCYANDPEWVHDLAYAMTCAVEFLENEEFSGDDSKRQEAAFLAVAGRISRMLQRHVSKYC
jgi:hypothetical protein